MFSHQEIYFGQWSFGIRLCSSKWSFSCSLAFFLLTNDVWAHFVFQSRSLSDFGTVPSWKARTDCSSSLCSFWWNRNVLWCFLGTKWSFIAKRGTNCSKLRICSGTNWSFMDDFGTIVPKKCVPFYNIETCFYKETEHNGQSLLRKTYCCALWISSGTNCSLIDGLGTIVPKNVFLLRTRERVFNQKTNNETKWSVSVKVEPFVPRSELRAEQFRPLCVIW